MSVRVPKHVVYFKDREPYSVPTTPPKPLEEPSITQLAENFIGAVSRWSSAGFPTITREQYEERSGICESCEFWDGKARLGLGKCNAPMCGCTKFKRWLATEQCRHPKGSKWPTLPS